MKGTIKIYVKPVDDDHTSVNIDVGMDDLYVEDCYVLLLNLMTAFEFTSEDMQRFGRVLQTGALGDIVVKATSLEPDTEEGQAFREELEKEFEV